VGTLININDNTLEPTGRVLGQFYPSSWQAVIASVRLSEKYGISIALTGSPCILAFAKGIPLWLAIY
jgi:hypothetical protein